MREGIAIKNNEYLKFPFTDPEWLRKIIVGCAITIVPLLNLAALGYFIECLRLGNRGRHALPQWNQWRAYFIDGFMALVIAAVYLLIPILALVFGAGMVGTALLAGILGLMVPAAVASYAVFHDLSSAFNLRDLLNEMGRVLNHYLLAYIANALILALAIILLLSIPMLAFISALLVFYVGVVYWNYIGWLYHS